ncbi:MAG: hypothetical protein M1837_005528 [Sclerophora amabilis]|nr:MAG: hypothetical protein M1837_005528 [Sclerophora amabilis]
MADGGTFYVDAGTRYEKASERGYGFYAVQYPPYVEDDLDDINGRLPGKEYMQPPAGFDFPLDLPNLQRIKELRPEDAVQDLRHDVTDRGKGNLQLIQALRDKERNISRDMMIRRNDALRALANPPTSNEIVFLLHRSMKRRVRNVNEIRRGESYVKGNSIRKALHTIRSERLASAGITSPTPSLTCISSGPTTSITPEYSEIDDCAVSIQPSSHSRGDPHAKISSEEELQSHNLLQNCRVLEFLNRQAHLEAKSVRNNAIIEKRPRAEYDEKKIKSVDRNDKVVRYLGLASPLSAPPFVPLIVQSDPTARLDEEGVQRKYQTLSGYQDDQDNAGHRLQQNYDREHTSNSSSSIHLVPSSEVRKHAQPSSFKQTRSVRFADTENVRLITRSPSVASVTLDTTDDSASERADQDSREHLTIPPITSLTGDLSPSASTFGPDLIQALDSASRDVPSGSESSSSSAPASATGTSSSSVPGFTTPPISTATSSSLTRSASTSERRIIRSTWSLPRLESASSTSPVYTVSSNEKLDAQLPVRPFAQTLSLQASRSRSAKSASVAVDKGRDLGEYVNPANGVAKTGPSDLTLESVGQSQQDARNERCVRKPFRPRSLVVTHDEESLSRSKLPMSSNEVEGQGAPLAPVRALDYRRTLRYSHGVSNLREHIKEDTREEYALLMAYSAGTVPSHGTTMNRLTRSKMMEHNSLSSDWSSSSSEESSDLDARRPLRQHEVSFFEDAKPWNYDLMIQTPSPQPDVIV